ncbi:MAG: corrinoid protein [Candidatus Aminicenantes bacterium]|nr:corrinoid protein [Candidatus Aminicenantes bacterium]
MKILKDISESVEKGDSAAVKELTHKAMSQKIPVENIMNKGLIKGMDAVGVKFKKNEIFIPEVLISTRAMKAGMDILNPFLEAHKKRILGKIVIGTVKGDLHDIGKKIVYMILEREGYEIIDLGIDVSKSKFISAVKKEKPQLLGMSALLTTTMIYMGEVIQAIEKAGLRQKLKIAVGGGPVTQAFADEIGADGYAPDAIAASELANKLLEK